MDTQRRTERTRLTQRGLVRFAKRITQRIPKLTKLHTHKQRAHQQRRLGWRLCRAVIGSIIALACGLNQAQAQTNEPQRVVVDSVRTEMVAEQIWVPATVVSLTDAQVATEVSGRLEWVAPVGGVVEAGQPLAKIDDHVLRLTWQQAKANSAKWQAQLILLDKQQRRLQTMAQNQSASVDELDSISAQYAVAKQELAQAKLDAAQAEYRLRQAHVTAPFNALVVARLQNAGEYTNIGQSVVRIVDPSNIEAQVRAPLSVAPFVQTGVQVTVKDGQQHQTYQRISAIVPVGNGASRSMELRVALAPHSHAIGAPLRVLLPKSDAYLATTVPRDALVLRQSGIHIYQINAQNQAVRVPVTTGMGLGDRVEVIGELDHDAQVIVRGAERIRDGQTVRMDNTNMTLVGT